METIDFGGFWFGEAVSGEVPAPSHHLHRAGYYLVRQLRYELGLRVLKPGGLLSFIVTNKWIKAGYGEPLRRFFGEHAWVKSVVEFGHAKQIFEDADVFPSIIVARRPTKAAAPQNAKLCAIPREQLRIDEPCKPY